MPAEPEKTGRSGEEKVEALLRRWGSDVRAGQAKGPSGETLFEPPRNLTALHGALDEADVELAAPARPALLRRGSWHAVPRRAMIAAVLTIAAIGALFIFLPKQVEKAPGGEVPRITDLILAAFEAPVRGAAEHGFKSGERVSLECLLDRPGWAFVAMLDSSGKLTSVGDAVRTVTHGSNRLGPFRLDDHAGTESFVVLVSAVNRTKEEFERVVADADGRALGDVLASLRALPGMTAQAVTFQHLPKG